MIILAVASLSPRRLDAQTPTTVLGVPCASVAQLGIDKQENFRAGLIMIGCGLSAPGETEESDGALEGTLELFPSSPTNINLITGQELFPKVTQSESMVWRSTDGTTIVVNYNDSSGSPANFSGVSVSTDGGATFTRLLPAPFATGHGTNFGDPIVVFDAALNTWFAGDLVARGDCGNQGIGVWTSPDGVNWATGSCPHIGSSDDRESMWVDNNAASPFYGRMYISYNNFAAGGGRLEEVYSDDGITWSAPVVVTLSFIRNVQLTGSPGTEGTVFIAAMNEGGGGLSPRTNVMFRSSDGGNTWTTIVMGPSFAAPGTTGCGYFARILPIWRHMGWGQPGTGPKGVVHYAYAGAGVNAGDQGDIYYTRSLDNGDTWSAPVVLNSDAAAGGSREQWMPSLSVAADGNVEVTWYDRRNTTDGVNYEYWGIHSLDNGATWLPDAPISDTLIDQPEQPDPNVQACYAGDYNYHSALGAIHATTWTDGRNAVLSHPQQDVYFAQVAEPISFIDQKCYAISGDPLNLPLHLDHLNPLFQQLGIPPEDVVLQQPQQLCVPVAKNGVVPPADVLNLVQFIDLKCYAISGDPLNLQLLLEHLDPVMQQLGAPAEIVTVLDPVQLCVPVAKNGVIPPPEVLNTIQFIDLKCYNITGDPLNLPLHLDHLNPVFQQLGIPPEDVVLQQPQQLCVPVAKNGVIPPPDVLTTVQFIDQKCYAITGDPLNLALHLDHLNPVLQQLGVPPEDVILQQPQQLCVPVRKSLP